MEGQLFGMQFHVVLNHLTNNALVCVHDPHMYFFVEEGR